MTVSEADSDETTPVKITVIDVTRLSAGKLFALASVEIEIDGIVMLVHGIQAVRTNDGGTMIDPPRFRDSSGRWRSAVTLPPEINRPVGRAVLDAMRDQGIVASKFTRR